MAKVSKRIADAVRKIEGGDPPRDGTVDSTDFAPDGQPYTLALITDFELLAANRWLYGWSSAYILADRTVAIDDTGPSGTTVDNPALNLAEAKNISTGVQGNSINVDGDAYPAGFELQPVGGRLSFDSAEAVLYATIGAQVLVRMYFDSLADGTVQPTFHYINANDGTCT